jgi:hypothetical protein
MPRTPTPPDTLWLLWNETGGDDDQGCLVQFCHEKATGLMVFETEGDASLMAVHEMAELVRVFDDVTTIRPVPIRVGRMRSALEEIRSALAAEICSGRDFVARLENPARLIDLIDRAMDED